MKKYYFILIVIMFFVASCASSYKPRGWFFNNGYKEAQLADNIFEVSFKGNPFTDMERTRDFALLRNAELMKEKGYNYFIVVDKIDDSTHETMYSGNNRNLGFKSDIQNPQNSLTAEGFKSKAEVKGDKAPFESDIVIKSIRAKYNMKDK